MEWIVLAVVIAFVTGWYLGDNHNTAYYSGYWRGRQEKAKAFQVKVTKPHDRSTRQYEVLWKYPLNSNTYHHLAYYKTESACHDAIRDFRKCSPIFKDTTFRHRTPDRIASDIVKSIQYSIEPKP